MADITKFDDVIDSRDVIARIEELEGLRLPWIAGWNMPGYLPDSDPAGFETFEEARDYIAKAILEAVEGEEDRTAPHVVAAEEASARWATFSEGEHGETVGQLYCWIARAENEGLCLEDHAELVTLRALAKEWAGYSDDWEYGATLIRDSYFKTYAQELADDIGAINADAKWPMTCIDWDQATRELQMDYSSVEFDGVTYWTR